MKTVNCLPPIIQYFDKMLLSKPTPKFCEDSETLWRIYEYISFALVRRAKAGSRKRERVEQQIEEFLAIYERITKKEKDLEGKDNRFGKGSFYSLTIPDGYSKMLRDRIKRKADSFRSAWKDGNF